MMNTEKKSIEKLIQEETEKRLKEMETAEYIYPPTITKTDWLLIAGLIFISLILIVYCMVEDF